MDRDLNKPLLAHVFILLESWPKRPVRLCHNTIYRNHGRIPEIIFTHQNMCQVGAGSNDPNRDSATHVRICISGIIIVTEPPYGLHVGPYSLSSCNLHGRILWRTVLTIIDFFAANLSQQKLQKYCTGIASWPLRFKQDHWLRCPTCNRSLNIKHYWYVSNSRRS